jgi:ABC-type sulfate/molybdate transport systems ATPase subunit
MATHDHDFALTAAARIVTLAEGRIAEDSGNEDTGNEDTGNEDTADDGITRPVS